MMLHLVNDQLLCVLEVTSLVAMVTMMTSRHVLVIVSDFFSTVEPCYQAVQLFVQNWILLKLHNYVSEKESSRNMLIIIIPNKPDSIFEYKDPSITTDTCILSTSKQKFEQKFVHSLSVIILKYVHSPVYE